MKKFFLTTQLNRPIMVGVFDYLPIYRFGIPGSNLPNSE